MYLDASAVVKLIIEERESPILRGFLRPLALRVSSEILLTESARAVRSRVAAGGVSESDAHTRLSAVLAGINLWSVGRGLLSQAGRLDPVALGTLDAIHVATALSVPGTPAAFVSYDRRQLEAARRSGLETASPGAEAA